MTPLQLFWSSQPAHIVRFCFAAAGILYLFLMVFRWTDRKDKPHKHNDPDRYAGA